MPKSELREYRAMPVMSLAQNKRLESDFYVEGYATTFNDPYVLYEDGDAQYKEQVDRDALVGADLSDVIMQYDHSGRVFARNKMGKNKPQTLIVETNDQGIFIAADLSRTDEARKMFSDIDEGLIYQMSWAFTVAEDSYNAETRTRTILKIKKVYDVSAVSIPANPSTDISSRVWLDGAIETYKQELLNKELKIKAEITRKKTLLLIQIEREKNK